ncbi:hypothetical protein [Neolewinella litorea]|uniref:PH domain-containing protein n=1 Tax=Neolewinella litorea TaxID=2562452 RepID=A0A4S4NHS9_9BACT|nr:hypothetical protein [Neolewinella litorea]THH39264.1 hypothetical protein E4021_10930 [Neolewinella litorea]
MKTPPYQLIATVGSILLVAFVLAAYRFFPGQLPPWTFTLAWVVAALVLLGTVMELWLMWRDYRAGYLFPMRNASLFILLFSVIGLPAYLVFAGATGRELGPATLLLVPVFLAFATRNLFRVRIDNLTLQAKTGFRAPVEVPLFQITEVSGTEDKITVHSEGHRPVQLLRVFFLASHWRALRDRLGELATTRTP